MAESSPCNTAATSDPDRIDKDFEVYLNVYDASSANPFFHLLGLGWYRSSVLVHGREYTFRPESKKGPREYGIVTADEHQVQWFQGLQLRASIPIGQTHFYPIWVSRVVVRLQNEYNMATYDPLTKNCHHFTDLICRELTGSGIPPWVNRITVIWPLCKCLLPPDPEEEQKEERRNIMFASR